MSFGTTTVSYSIMFVIILESFGNDNDTRIQIMADTSTQIFVNLPFIFPMYMSFVSRSIKVSVYTDQ